MDIYEYATDSGLRGVTGTGRLHGGGGTRTTGSPLLLRRMRATLLLGWRFALDGEALAFCLLRCCCVAVPCPHCPGEQTGQRPSPLLMLRLCRCHCPASLVDRYPRSSGSSVMLWATLRQPWDPRDRPRQEPPVGARCPVTPVDGMISGHDYDYDYIYIYIYIAESPLANPRFFLEGALEPRGRHRVSRPRRTKLPPGSPHPHGRVRTTTASPPAPSAPPKKGLRRGGLGV